MSVTLLLVTSLMPLVPITQLKVLEAEIAALTLSTEQFAKMR